MSVLTILNETIVKYVQSPVAGYAIHLDGGWGEGKSHYVNGRLSEHLNDRKIGIAVISLFGLSSKSDLENEMLGAFAMLANTEYSAIGNALTEAAETLSFNTENNLTVSGGLIPALMSVTFRTLRAKRLKNMETRADDMLFVFDDLERFQGPMSIPMAYMSKLIEQGVHCLVICNTEKVSNPNSVDDFRSFKEKVVGRTLRFELTEAEIRDAVIANILDDQAKALFHRIFYFAQFCNDYPFREFRNLRQVLKAAFMIGDLQRNLGESFTRSPLCVMRMFHYALHLVAERAETFSPLAGDLFLPIHRELVASCFENGYLTETLISNTNSYSPYRYDLSTRESAWPGSISLDVILDGQVSVNMFDQAETSWKNHHDNLLKQLREEKCILPIFQTLQAIESYILVRHKSKDGFDYLNEYLDALGAYYGCSLSENARFSALTLWKDGLSTRSDPWDFGLLVADFDQDTRIEFAEKCLPKIKALAGLS